MNGTHLHLLLNHFPIIGTLIAAALMAWAVYKNDTRLKAITAVMVIIVAVISFIADQTGETAEHALKGVAGISRDAVHEHEHAAGPANLVLMITGLLCIGFLVVERRKLPAAKNVFIACFALTIVAFGLMARAGYYGGLIRHPEITGAVETAPANSAGTEQGEHN